MPYVYKTSMNNSKVSTITVTKFFENRAIIRVENVDYSQPSKRSNSAKVETFYTTVRTDTFVETVENFINDKANSVEIQNANNVFGNKDSIKFVRVDGGFEITIDIYGDKCSCFIDLDNLKDMLKHLK